VAEYEPKPLGKNAEVGIDLGLKEGMTLSTGAKVENSRMFAKHENALAYAQRNPRTKGRRFHHGRPAPVPLCSRPPLITHMWRMLDRHEGPFNSVMCSTRPLVEFFPK
jgi:hypothetical protein